MTVHYTSARRLRDALLVARSPTPCEYNLKPSVEIGTKKKNPRAVDVRTAARRSKTMYVHADTVESGFITRRVVKIKISSRVLPRYRTRYVHSERAGTKNHFRVTRLS